MTEFERAAEKMVTFIPPEIAGGNGSVYIGPHDSEEQGWELYTIRGDPGVAERACNEIRRLIVALLTSRARPAAGWRKAEPGQTFEDGDLILCAVPLMPSGFDYCVLSVKCDEGYFRLDLDGEPWGWEWSDVAWWMPCPKAPAAAQAERGEG